MIKFIQLASSMKRERIDDLSAIAENRQNEDSRMTFQDSKPRANILCPRTNYQNYQCIICNRLRKVCPFTTIPYCRHQRQLQRKIVRKNQTVFIDKSNFTTLPNERLRTQSINEGNRNIFVNQKESQYIPDTSQNNGNKASFNSTQYSPIRTSTEEIIYYPVIHNHLVLSPAPKNKKQVIKTPNRSNKSRKIEIEGVLTPVQYKELLEYYRQQ